MGSNSFLSKSRPKGGSSVGSDKDLNARLRRTKIRRPMKMSEYGSKRIPDYTELAYKEAVSKLRYFLSGNYSPSIRSYGGSASIKNLDESDGDIEKRYPYTLDKPRPRLTAKYTSLYADSLKNYTPPVGVGNVTSPPAPAPAPAEASPDVVQFIQKQEEYIEQLERESQYCREELNSLLGKVKDVISENEHLQDQQKTRLISRMLSRSDSDDADDLGESGGDSDHKSCQKPRPKPRARLAGPSIVFESRISELEAQLTQATIDLKKVQEENNENKRKLAAGLGDTGCLDGFKRQIENLQRDKSSLESQLSSLRAAGEARGEARGEGDRARGERQRLEAEVRRLKEDLASERAKIRELAGEGARRAAAERSAAESRYHQHFDDLTRDLAAQYDAVAKLQMELERQRRDESDLKREVSLKAAAVDDLRMELKNKTASLQADVSAALAERAAAAEELHAARLALERLQRQARHEANRRDAEIASLRQRLDRSEAELVHARREGLRLADQLAGAEKDLTMKNLTPTSPEKNKREKDISSALESIENKHARTVAELETMIQSQNSLMEKLTGECRSLTDKLDDANRRHKEELATLHHQVEYLGRSLQVGTADTSYSAQPTYTNTTNGNGQYHPTDARPIHSGPDATRHPQASRRPSIDHRQTRNNSRIVSRQSSRTSMRQESPTNASFSVTTPQQEMDAENYANTTTVPSANPVYPTNYENQLGYNQNHGTYNKPQNSFGEQQVADLGTSSLEKTGNVQQGDDVMPESNEVYEQDQPNYVQNQPELQNNEILNKTNYNENPVANQAEANYNQDQSSVHPSQNSFDQNQIQYDSSHAYETNQTNIDNNQVYDPNVYGHGNYDPNYQNYDATAYEQGYAYDPNNTYEGQYDPNITAQTVEAQNIPVEQSNDENRTPQTLERNSPIKTELKS